MRDEKMSALVDAFEKAICARLIMETGRTIKRYKSARRELISALPDAGGRPGAVSTQHPAEDSALQRGQLNPRSLPSEATTAEDEAISVHCRNFSVGRHPTSEITDKMDEAGYLQQCHEFTERVRDMLGAGYGIGYQLDDLFRILEARSKAAEEWIDLTLRVGVLERALKPFAKLASVMDGQKHRLFVQLLVCPDGDDHPENYRPNLQAARAALHSTQEG